MLNPTTQTAVAAVLPVTLGSAVPSGPVSATPILANQDVVMATPVWATRVRPSSSAGPVAYPVALAPVERPAKTARARVRPVVLFAAACALTNKATTRIAEAAESRAPRRHRRLLPVLSDAAW